MSFCCFRKTLDLSPSTAQDRKGFFVITTIFNPASFSRRYELYHRFVQHMNSMGVQLVTIECIFPSLNQTTFQITDSKNPLHIQIRSKSVYWVKENLINIAVSRLPPHAKWIAWLDADITFHSNDWVDQTIAALKEKYLIVQLFKKARFLGPSGETLRTDHSFGYSVLQGKVIDQNRYDEWYPHPGYGWATSIQTFREIGGLPEYDIVGSGDLHFAFSLLNQVSNALEDQLDPEFKQCVLNQSTQTHDKLQKSSKSLGLGVVGYIPVTISHNWHGSRRDRQYVGRWKILVVHQFNVLKDMVRTNEGLLQFDSEKQALEQDIIKHFHLRYEDSKQCVEEDRRVTQKIKDKKKDKGQKNRNSWHHWDQGDTNDECRAPIATPECPPECIYPHPHPCPGPGDRDQDHCHPPDHWDVCHPSHPGSSTYPVGVYESVHMSTAY